MINPAWATARGFILQQSFSLSSVTVGENPPKSCVGWADAVLGLAVLLAVFFALRVTTDISSAVLCVLMIAANALAVGTLEILRAPWRKRPPSSEPFAVILKRAGVKYLGLLLAVGTVSFLYWLFPEYDRAYYKSYFDVGPRILPWVLAGAAFYLVWAEWRIPDTKDGALQAGRLLLGKWKDADWKKLRHFALSWLVKGYFLPIMWGDLAKGIDKLRDKNWDVLDLTFMQIYSLVFSSSVTFELVFVTAGYLFTCRIFDAQVRLVEQRLYGWLVALICYGPFLSVTFTRYFGYRTDVTWGPWLSDHPAATVIWGSVIMVCMILHLWSDACFGVRFSNLTHRGIITNGPYRYSKHPAYIIKNLRWWMVSVPFAAGGWEKALNCSLLLLCVNIVYGMRAYAEEKMLSQDPRYIEYALWMDRRGLMRWVGRICPAFRYETRLEKWLEKGEVQVLPEEHFRG